MFALGLPFSVYDVELVSFVCYLSVLLRCLDEFCVLPISLRWLVICVYCVLAYLLWILFVLVIMISCLLLFWLWLLSGFRLPLC